MRNRWPGFDRAQRIDGIRAATAMAASKSLASISESPECSLISATLGYRSRALAHPH